MKLARAVVQTHWPRREMHRASRGPNRLTHAPRSFAREVLWPVPRRGPNPFVVAAALACFFVVAAGALVRSFIISFDDPSRHTVTERTVESTAHRAAEWAATLGCPRSFAELGVDDKDPWGNTYVLACERTGTITVISRGEDGILGTADDIRTDVTGWSRTP